MKKVLASVLVFLIILTSTPIGLFSVNAATNPYGKWQTISGVTTVRCTYYAWQQAYDNTGVQMPNFGNAKNWYSSAQNAGYSVGTTPKAKSIAVWTNSGYGHVAYVVSVNGSKMTVNEGGMLDTNGNAYNGDGIINGSVCNSTVGSNKSSYSSSVLVGFIYLTESYSGSVSISSQSDRNTITNTNAIMYARVDKPSSQSVTKIGIKIRKDGTAYSAGWSRYDAPSRSYSGESYMLIYYNMNTELKLTLTHATKYWIMFYAVVGGKEYWSTEYYFFTTGSHSYGSWSTTNSATCTSTGTQTRKCNGCSKTETKTISENGHKWLDATCTKAKMCQVCGVTNGSKLKHAYTNSCDTTCNICNATRTVTHSYKTTTTKATLTKNGSVVKKCSACGKVSSNTAIKYPKTIKLSTASYTYNGKVKTPTITVKDSAGKTLKKNTDYTVTYANGRKNVGKYKVTVKMKGKYSGTKTIYFTIKPKAASINKLTAKKKAITVKINRSLKQSTGYQIQYATNKSFKSAKTKNITSYKTISTTLTKLTSKKTYYVRVRTYKTVSGKKYYSGWSTYKSAKAK